MPKQIVFNVTGIEGDAFESAEVVFPKELGGVRGNDIIVRKKPGRTKSHQVVLTPGEQIPEPERAVDVTVNLYDGSNTLVASGTDTVAPPGSDAAVPNPERVVEHLDGMLATIEEIQGALRFCKDDLCATVLEHSFARTNHTRRARGAVEEGAYAAATESLLSVKRIVEGDIDLLESEGDSDTHRDALALERRLLGETTAALGVMPGDNV